MATIINSISKNITFPHLLSSQLILFPCFTVYLSQKKYNFLFFGERDGQNPEVPAIISNHGIFMIYLNKKDSIFMNNLFQGQLRYYTQKFTTVKYLLYIIYIDG